MDQESRKGEGEEERPEDWVPAEARRRNLEGFWPAGSGSERSWYHLDNRSMASPPHLFMQWHSPVRVEEGYTMMASHIVCVLGVMVVLN